MSRGLPISPWLVADVCDMMKLHFREIRVSICECKCVFWIMRKMNQIYSLVLDSLFLFSHIEGRRNRNIYHNCYFLNNHFILIQPG